MKLRLLLLSTPMLMIAAITWAAVFNDVKISPDSKTPIDSTAIFEVASTSKGVLFPRMTTAQRLAISNPADSLLVYDSDVDTLMIYTASTTSWGFLLTGLSALGGGRAVYTTAGGVLAASTTTAIELGYLNGSGVTAGGVLYGNGSAFRVSAASTTGDLLMSGGTGTPIWHTPASTNTPYAVVKRDVNGDFASRTITGATSLKTPVLLDNGAGLTVHPSSAQDLFVETTGSGHLKVSGYHGLEIAQTTTPSSVTSGYDSLYFKSDDVPYYKTNGGVEKAIQPMTTTGDIIIASTSGTAIRLPVGTNGQVLVASSTSTGGIKWATNSASSGGGSMYGSAFWPAVSSCTWTSTSATMSSYSADADCTFPSGGGLAGGATAPGTKIPAITFATLDDGDYRIVAKGAFYNAVNNQCGYEFYDGTNSSEGSMTYPGVGAIFWPVIEGRIRRTSGSNITFEIRTKSFNGVGDCQIFNDSSGSLGLTITVYKYPY